MQFRTIVGSKLKMLGIAALAGIAIAAGAPAASAQSYNHNNLFPGQHNRHTPTFGHDSNDRNRDWNRDRDHDGDWDRDHRDNGLHLGQRYHRWHSDNGLHLGQRRVYNTWHHDNGLHLGQRRVYSTWHRDGRKRYYKHVTVRHHSNPWRHGR